MQSKERGSKPTQRKNRFMYGFDSKQEVQSFIQWRTYLAKEVAKAKYPTLMGGHQDEK